MKIYYIYIIKVALLQFYFYNMKILNLYVILYWVVNLKILYKNTTKYNESIYLEFLQFHKQKFGLKYTLYTAFIVGLLLFCLVLQIKIHNLSLAIIFCIAVTCFFLWRYLHPISEVSKDLNSNKIQNEEEFTFIFYEKYFKIRNRLKTNKVKYYELYKVFETSKFFYLYIDKTHSLLLDKEKFSIGLPNDFSNFMHKKCWYKFKK